MDINKALNILLSDEYKLLIKTRNFHWNVTGPFFGPLHDLFGKQYEKLSDLTDRIAERVRQLKGQSFGSMQQFLSTGRLTETNNTFSSINHTTMISLLLSDHEAMIEAIRKMAAAVENEDCVTANLLQEWASKHEKMAWFLRAHLGPDDKK